MIDILYNKLGACNDVSLAEWKDVEQAVFYKHSQHSQASQQHQQPNKENSNTTKKASHIPEVCEEKVLQAAPVIQATPVIQAAPVIQASKVRLTDISSNKKKPSKDATIKPFEIIMSETLSFHNSTDYIKESLITMISKEEFSKIFGLTKCAEIMSGIVNNRWNKSTALFISFLFDKEVYYNDKIVLYNKEKNRGRITIP
uniref:Uncharacterized protein n=1 Tax=viral metagenome TaxID=1070528 RepID=A0A6C0L851_9ZZZZ